MDLERVLRATDNRRTIHGAVNPRIDDDLSLKVESDNSKLRQETGVYSRNSAWYKTRGEVDRVAKGQTGR